MKPSFSMMALLGAVAAKQDLQACMYCKRLDTYAGFNENWSYCNDIQNEKCIKDFVDYLNPTLQCTGQPKAAWELDLVGDCNGKAAPPASCPGSFKSAASMEYKPQTVLKGQLGVNQFCTMQVDATDAAVQFTISNNNLGVVYPGYLPGNTLYVAKGGVKYFKFYNGGQSGTLSFNTIFKVGPYESGAKQVAASMLVAASAVIASLA